MDVTFDTLIRRYSEDIAYLAGGDNGPLTIPQEGFTPERFTELVEDAAAYLDRIPVSPYFDYAEELHQAAIYLNDALTAEPGPVQHAFLAKAGNCIDVAEPAAQDLALSC
ncbi:hypothetical protein ACIQWA_36600 [Kitasatospora sp. NPDC098652]|uniref:hypothetical protein n=1 Tax=Kitasatospora sp. NPDC098652 TaxID=3364095 RepID=UPI00381D262D